MNEDVDDTPGICRKIALLIEERGWNQDQFAQLAQLSRSTVRHLLNSGPAKPQNKTVGACARALGLSVDELNRLPVERLLSRMKAPNPSPLQQLAAPAVESLSRRYEEITQPELQAWMERNPDRAGRLTTEEMDELLSLQGTGGPMTGFGVAHFVDLIERKRELVRKVHILAGTEYMDLVEQFIDVLFEKVQPYRNR